MARSSIEEIAREAHERHQAELDARAAESSKETPAEESKEEVTDSSEGMVFTEDDMTTDDAESIVKNAEKSQGHPESASIKMLTKDEIISFMPDMDATIRSKHADVILKNMMEYRNKLITEEGMTPDEANRAIRSRGKKVATGENNKWLDDHPHTGVITIEKGKEDQLGLTKEEHDKLVTTNVIELHLVTSEELKNTPIKDVPVSGSKLDYVRTLNSLAVHTVPLLSLGDTATFRSATSAEIIRSGITSDSKTPLQSIDKLSSFLYDHFVSCHTFSKYDDKNVNILNYQDFCDKFPFFDIPMAEYAIYHASSPSSIKVDLSCNRCGKPFTWDMKPEKMLDISAFEDKDKKEYDTLHAHFNDVEWLEKHSTEKMTSIMMQSPISKNRLIVQNPTISRAKQVMQAAEKLGLYDVEDDTNESDLNTKIISSALMINSLYIYSEKDNGYIEFGPDEIEDILRILPSIPNEDFRMIDKFSLKYFYSPSFSSGAIKCPNCHKDIYFQPTAEQLLFLYAREEFRIQ